MYATKLVILAAITAFALGVIAGLVIRWNDTDKKYWARAREIFSSTTGVTLGILSGILLADICLSQSMVNVTRLLGDMIIVLASVGGCVLGYLIPLKQPPR
jgi:hypothetical protein